MSKRGDFFLVHAANHNTRPESCDANDNRIKVRLSPC